ncbi:hypothetical protein [Aeoliella sp.]|uniref:hypothetical protein n=1 Tax=Aeoliella sp. TaxID=2795800 RepID=UPI003CCBA316
MRISSKLIRTATVATLLVLAVDCSADDVVVPPAVPNSGGFFTSTMGMMKRCRLRCAASPAGKMLANMVEPFSKLTGGIIPSCKCNEFDQALALNAPPPGVGPPPPPPPAVAAAAKIQADQAQAGLRRQAVAALAGVDCRYYPEAEVALIASLRADRSECVRLEAAKVLKGCCCRSPDIVKALTICAAGTDIDGNPCERSNRVRLTALAALQCCQTCDPTQTTPTTPPEQPIGATDNAYPTTQVSYEQPVADPPTAAECDTSAPSSGGSLLELWKRSE